MGLQKKRLGSNWYVIQVNTGSEDRMCHAIERVCDDFDAASSRKEDCVGLSECFSPRFASRKKRMGEWRDVQRRLLPGYVIAEAQNPEALAIALHSVRDFCRILASGEAYSSLDEAERIWIEKRTKPGERVVPLSFGYKEGDKLVVNEGPLEGCEGLITRVDRKNSMAHLMFHVGQMTIRTTVGLVVLPKGETGANISMKDSK